MQELLFCQYGWVTSGIIPKSGNFQLVESYQSLLTYEDQCICQCKESWPMFVTILIWPQPSNSYLKAEMPTAVISRHSCVFKRICHFRGSTDADT